MEDAGPDVSMLVNVSAFEVLAPTRLCACYAMPGTDVVYAATRLRTRYAMPGTDIVYCARLLVQRSVLPGSTDLGLHGVYCHKICTDRAYGATREGYGPRRRRR
eukprot:39279-Rhodomonas_salina.4